MTKTQDLKYRIGADFGELKREAQNAGTATRAFQRELAALEKKQREHRRSLEDLGRGMATFGAAVTAGLGIAAKAAIEWETAFTGVRKTVDGSDQEIAALEGELRQLARTLPTTHDKIAAVAESAGQLGIKRQDIAAFTRTMVDLGNTTNLTAEQAAEDLAKFSNIMGTSSKDVDRLGAALVALGNDGASTEKDIIAMGLRIAGAGKQIGLTEAQVLGFASALSSVGIEAEAGGSSISTAMIKIAAAVNAGSADLETFAKVAQMSVDDFSMKFRTDAAGAITAFISGIGEMQRTGQDVFAVLDDLGLAEIRVRDALLRAGGAAELFSKSLQVGSAAWAENSALTEEADKRYETAASRLAVAGNQIKDTLIDVGATVVPVVATVGTGIADIVRGFQNLPGPVKEVVTWVGLAVAGLTLFGGAALIATPKILAFRESMSAMAAAGGAGSKALAGFGRALIGPVGIALTAGITLLGVFAAKSGAAAASQERLRSAAKEIADAITEQNGVIDANVRKVAAKKAVDEGLIDTAQKLGVQGGDVVKAILGEGDAYERVMRIAAERFNNIKENDPSSIIDGEGKAVFDLISKLQGLNGETKNQVAANKAATSATDQSKTSQEKLAEQSKKSAEQIKLQNEALDGLIERLNELSGIHLTFREAQRAYIEQAAETAKVLEKNGKGLDINTEKGRENARSLDAQAESMRGMAEAAAREAQARGGAAAGAAALTASLEASRPALIKQAEAFGMSGKEAIAYADAVLGIPTGVEVLMSTPGSEEALAELQAVKQKILEVPPNKTIDVGVLSKAAQQQLTDLGFRVKELPNGHVEVTANTVPAQREFDRFVSSNYGRQILLYGKYVPPSINERGFGRAGMDNALGNIVSFARGGMFENHAPQIVKAGPGTVRVWAEPDTDRESYIPWAMDRRSRATGILRTTADAFGYALVPQGRMAAQSSRGATATAAMGSSSIVVQAGVIGSRTELLSWLAWANDELKRRGRA